MTKEAEINKQSLALQDIVDDLMVNNSVDLENAVNMVRAIKKHKDMIIEYWREAKESAKKTYHEISSKEKSMLNICDSAEKSIRDKITKYNLLQKACRDEMIHQANAEKTSLIKHILDEAREFQAHGDLQEAEEKFSQAEKLQNIKTSLSEKSFINGITTQKRFKCRVTDNELVPCFFNGVEIREINTKKLLEIRKENLGVKIPGVEFYQEESVVIRL